MSVSAVAGAATAAPFFGALQHGSAAQATTGSGSSTGSNSYSVDNIGSTFLSLLVQELKNQDPTQPMDPTAMVGQMISLNQLNQLVSINQDLTPTTTQTIKPSTPVAPHVQTSKISGALPEAHGASPAASGVAALDPMQTAAGLAGQQAAMAAALGATNPTAAADNATPLDLGKLTALFGGK